MPFSLFSLLSSHSASDAINVHNCTSKAGSECNVRQDTSSANSRRNVQDIRYTDNRCRAISQSANLNTFSQYTANLTLNNSSTFTGVANLLTVNLLEPNTFLNTCFQPEAENDNRLCSRKIVTPPLILILPSSRT